MRLFILFLLFSVSFAGEAGGGGDPKVQTTPEVQKILDARQKEIDTAALVYAQASIKANDKASKALEAVVKAKTQKGDLEGALAAKNILDQWKKESQEASNQILLGQDSSFPVGKWSFKAVGWNFSDDESCFTLSKDGTWTSPWANFGGTWKVVDQTIQFVSDKGNNQKFSAPLKKEGNWTWSGAAVTKVTYLEK